MDVMGQIALDNVLETVAVGGGAFGLALAAGIKFFGLVTNAIRDRMEYKLKEREQETAESGSIFRNALEYIDRQNADIGKLREELKIQREELKNQRVWFTCELDSQRKKFETELEQAQASYKVRLKEQDDQIFSLRADLAKYKEILESGPVWAQKALRESGLD